MATSFIHWDLLSILSILGASLTTIQLGSGLEPSEGWTNKTVSYFLCIASTLCLCNLSSSLLPPSYLKSLSHNFGLSVCMSNVVVSDSGLPYLIVK